ncbi:MAG: hypothetical protein D6815_07390, partial [Candidatus Dadabacteria bacterium]
RTIAVLLGDNAYRHPPLGRPTARWPDIDRQLEATGAADLVVLVPGNHDWGKDEPNGVEALAREREYVTAAGGPRVRFAPSPGCPGPQRVYEDRFTRIVALDSAWWFRAAGERHRLARERGCPGGADAEVVERLAAELACSGPACPLPVVLAHHPLISGGGHAGYYGWRDLLWCAGLIALPSACLAAAVGRALEAGGQDMSSAAYRHYVEAMAAALPERPVVWASGHDHSLQLLVRDHLVQVVSGALSRTGGAGRTRATRYARSRLGFFVLEFAAGRPPVLEAIVVTGQGQPVREAGMVLRW